MNLRSAVDTASCLLAAAVCLGGFCAAVVWIACELENLPGAR